MTEEHYHFIGIGGIGMSALAKILARQGAKVTGSDLGTSQITETLKSEGIEIYKEHSEKNLDSASTVIYTTQVKKDNPEYQEALKRHLSLLHRSELLAKLMSSKNALLVTGTHGKTTTSSLLSHVLRKAGLDPSFAIGGIVKGIETNADEGKGTYFVAEADESDGSFLNYEPFGAIITNIDNDHLDYWKTEESLIEGFCKFAKKVRSKEHFFWCADDEKLHSLNFQGLSYGFREGSDLWIKNAFQVGFHLFFDISFLGEDYDEIEIPLIGDHNVLNAAAVFGLALSLKIPEKIIREAFKDFQGIKRRMEKKGEFNQALIFDDYGHHPTEIAKTLLALRTAMPLKRIIVAFQPHRYSRTQDCLEQYPSCFDYIDHLILTDIYGAFEQPIPGINSQVLLEKIKTKSRATITYVPRGELKDHLLKFLKPGDILLTLGAGDITQLGSQLVSF